MGAAGFLTKRAATHELVSAIRLVVQGQLYVTPTLAKLLVTQPDQPNGRPRHTALSDREFQVVCRIVYGKSISEIAEELSVSVSTVSTHRARAMEKMHMKNNAELVQYAIWHRLVPWRNPEVPI